MKILFLTSRAPFPPVGGDRLRAFHFIKALSKQHQVTLLCFAEDAKEEEEARPISRYVENLAIVKLEQYRSFLNCVLGLFSTKPLQVHYYRSTEMRRQIHEHLNKGDFDLIFVHLIRMADYINGLNGLPKIMDLTDALSMNYERSALYESASRLSASHFAQKVERRRIPAYEREIIDRFDCNLLISPVDRNYLATTAPVDKVKIIGPAVNLNYFEFHTGEFDPHTIIFLGKLSTFPNKDAIIYFCREIYPLVVERLQEIQLFIVGIEPGAEVLELGRHPNIHVTGYVPDVRPYIRSATLSICPMRTGAGAKNKVLESMAIGTPVVSTALGVEGLELEPGQDVLIADDREGFAAQILKIVEDRTLRDKLSRNGRKLIEQSYSWELVFRQLNGLVTSFGRELESHY